MYGVLRHTAGRTSTRNLMRFHEDFAPVKAAVRAPARDTALDSPCPPPPHSPNAPTRPQVLPIVRKDGLVEYATDVHVSCSLSAVASPSELAHPHSPQPRGLVQHKLSAFGCVDLDLTGSIGKRYRRQDEIGTPLCITVDGEGLDNGTVTLRCRDSTQQVR